MSRWPVKPLGEIVRFERGLTYSKSDEVAYSGNGVLRANNIDMSTMSLDLTDIRYISDLIQVPHGKKVRRGSLLICTASGSRSHLGKVAWIDDDYDLAFGGFMGLLTARPEIDGRFLYFLLTSARFEEKLASLAGGTNINNLKFVDIADFPVPVPPLEEQRRIVAVLDEAFAAIATATANAEKNLANARELSGLLIDAILAAESDQVSLTLHNVADPSCSLSYGIVQPGDDVEGGLPVVRPVDLKEHVVGLEGLKRIEPSLAHAYRRTCLTGDELLLCVRGTTGTISLALPELAGGNVTRGIVPIRFNPKMMTRAFGYYVMRSRAVQKQIRAATYGAALMQINIANLKKIVVQVPSLERQIPLSNKLEALDSELFAMQVVQSQKLVELATLRQSLLRRAFAGEFTGREPVAA